MRVRVKAKPEVVGFSNKFNINSLGEIIVYYYDRHGLPGGADSDYLKDYEVWLEQRQCWKPMLEAFKDRDLIIDNYNTRFFEPKTKEDRQRGYTL